MCLTNVKRIYPKEDIICYKVVTVSRNFRDRSVRYLSPYYSRKEWKLGKLESLKDRTDAEAYRSWGTHEKNVYGGAYHTHGTYESAERHAESYLQKGLHVKILECIIPKSSKYVYQGMIPVSNDWGYASQKLKPIKVVWE